MMSPPEGIGCQVISLFSLISYEAVSNLWPIIHESVSTAAHLNKCFCETVPLRLGVLKTIVDQRCIVTSNMDN